MKGPMKSLLPVCLFVRQFGFFSQEWFVVDNLNNWNI